MVVRPFYVYDEDSYTAEIVSLYGNGVNNGLIVSLALTPVIFMTLNRRI